MSTGAPGHVDGVRLTARIEALAAIGRFLHGPTGLYGVNRPALTDADAAARRQVIAWMEAAGLDVRVDAIGNVFGRRAGREPGLAPVMAGSHIDSVPTGGAFDGVLGVLGALEVVETLNDAGVVTRRPLVVAFFTEEEGARFGTDMLGSAVAVGRIPLEQALALADREGRTVKEELARIGFLGTEDPRLSPPHAYVELHIEQGPVLSRAGMELGVVTGVQAISWWKLQIQGRAAHAGTTPMGIRADAGAAAARLLLGLRDQVKRGEFGEEARVTVGRLETRPGFINIVPGGAALTVDLRNPDEAQMRRMEAALAALIALIEAEEGVQVSAEQTARTQPVPFDPAVLARVTAAAEGLGLRHQRILSGAGHDAQELASLCPTGMIFVPGEHDGISHNPREYSTPAATTAGASALLRVLLDLAEG